MCPNYQNQQVVAIHQPNYAPWCGYFAKMQHCDIFIFLDDAQMPGGQSYVYRTRIGTHSGPRWLSVPTRFHLGDAICQIQCADSRWSHKHLGTLRGEYGRSPYFREVWSLITPIYEKAPLSLSEFNQELVIEIARYLGIQCRFLRSSQLQVTGTSDERLISLVQAVGGTRYLSGKGGDNYQNPEKFRMAGIDLEVRAYSPVPYRQFHGHSILGLSILDAIFNLGKNAASLLIYNNLPPESDKKRPFRDGEFVLTEAINENSPD